MAALEGHFAQRLCEAAGVTLTHPVKDLFKPAVHRAIEAFVAGKTRRELERLAEEKDIPLLTMV